MGFARDVYKRQSLLWPMALDVTIFAFFGALSRLVSALRGTRFGRIGLSSVFFGLGATCLLWTYFGVLPASVGFDSAGASVARHEVAQAAQGVDPVSYTHLDVYKRQPSIPSASM